MTKKNVQKGSSFEGKKDEALGDLWDWLNIRRKERKVVLRHEFDFLTAAKPLNIHNTNYVYLFDRKINLYYHKK